MASSIHHGAGTLHRATAVPPAACPVPRAPRRCRCRSTATGQHIVSAAAHRLQAHWQLQPWGCSSTIIARAQPEDTASVAAPAEEPSPLLRTSLPCGELTVRLLQERDIRGAGLLLTRAFVGTPEAVALDEATEFMASQLKCPQLGVTLVARLVPTDPSLLPKGQDSRVVGTVALAFDLAEASGRDGLGRLRELSATACYLSNMAVDPKLRRNGIARAMLSACDTAAAASEACAAPPPRTEIWLHVREADDPARRLYEGAGFEVVEREAGGGGGGFLGFGGGPPRRARILMRRQVQQGS